MKKLKEDKAELVLLSTETPLIVSDWAKNRGGRAVDTADSHCRDEKRGNVPNAIMNVCMRVYVNR